MNIDIYIYIFFFYYLRYVKIKKVSGGERSESQLVAGIVCTKNVTHRGMPRRLSQPTLLLLGCSLVYQHRHEGRLSSLEPVIMQVFLKLFILFRTALIFFYMVQLFLFFFFVTL